MFREISFYTITFLLIISLTSCQKRVLNVLAFGDSITQGKLEADTIKELSYRYWFWEKLDSAGYHVNMVGSNHRWFKQNPEKVKIEKFSPYTQHKFKNHHEAYYGIKTGETLLGGFTHDSIKYKPLKDRILTFDKPDVTLIHIGTNDGNNDSLQTINYLKDILEIVYQRNPKTNILLAKLITPWVKFVNHSIEPIIKEFKDKHPLATIKYVDMSSGFVNCPEAENAMTFDWAHPNILGQKVMADKWFKAFKSIKDKSAPIFNPNIKTSYVNDSTLNIQWDVATDNKYLAGYEILINGKLANYRYSECGEKKKQSLSLIPHNNYQIKGINRLKIHTLQVVAVDFANNKTYSKPISIGPQLP